MSWEKAKKEAEAWLSGLALGDVQGRVIDLEEAAKALPFDGKFKGMILDAARRILKKRGADIVIFER